MDGRCYTERHVDGGVSEGIFFRPPYVPPGEQAAPGSPHMAGTQVWAIVAGKIFADPEVIRDWSLPAPPKAPRPSSPTRPAGTFGACTCFVC